LHLPECNRAHARCRRISIESTGGLAREFHRAVQAEDMVVDVVLAAITRP
jgi:hypothetical protein